MNVNNASTCGAILDASFGKNGIGDDCTALVCSLRRRTRRAVSAAAGVSVAPAENHKSNRHAQQGHDSAHADYGQNRGTVSGFRWIVLVAKQKQMIDWSSNLARGSVHQPQPNVAWRILDSEKVARDSSVRC